MDQELNIPVDEQAFAEIYESCWKDLYLFSCRYVDDRDIAKGFVQDVFITLWEKKETLKIRTSLKNYLYGAIKLKVLEYHRKKSVRERFMEHSLHSQHSGNNLHTENEVAFKELKHALTAAVERMPQRSRQVYEMSRNQGMDNKSIATTLMISEKAVEGNITRAIEFIKHHLRFFRHR